MAESISRELNLLDNAISQLEQALPKVITSSTHNEGIENIIQAAQSIKDLSFDKHMKSLALTMKVLSSGESMILRSVTYQAFILDVLEMLVKINNQIKKSGLPKTTDAKDLLSVGEFLIRLAGRVTNRFKINILFEPEYEAKAIRAFMVLKELREVVRFLNINPDITTNSNANLDNGMEIDLLSQESPNELHRIAGSVLEVRNVQIFTETSQQPVMMLDPPHIPDSFDNKMDEYFNL